MSDPTRPSAQLYTVLGVAAIIDLLTGIVLAVIGVGRDVSAFVIFGVFLIVSGGGMLALVTWQRNKPTVL